MKQYQNRVADISSKGMGVFILQSILSDRIAPKIFNLFCSPYSELLNRITLQKSVSKTVYNYPAYSL